MGMEPMPMKGAEATVVASLASGLRHTDPARRAEFAERLVAALDRNGYAIEMLVSKAIARPVALSMKPSTSRPMGQYNWLTWVRCQCKCAQDGRAQSLGGLEVRSPDAEP